MIKAVVYWTVPSSWWKRSRACIPFFGLSYFFFSRTDRISRISLCMLFGRYLVFMTSCAVNLWNDYSGNLDFLSGWSLIIRYNEDATVLLCQCWWPERKQCGQTTDDKTSSPSSFSNIFQCFLLFLGNRQAAFCISVFQDDQPRSTSHSRLKPAGTSPWRLRDFYLPSAAQQ